MSGAFRKGIGYFQSKDSRIQNRFLTACEAHPDYLSSVRYQLMSDSCGWLMGDEQCEQDSTGYLQRFNRAMSA